MTSQVVDFERLIIQPDHARGFYEQVVKVTDALTFAAGALMPVAFLTFLHPILAALVAVAGG